MTIGNTGPLRTTPATPGRPAGAGPAAAPSAPATKPGPSAPTTAGDRASLGTDYGSEFSAEGLEEFLPGEEPTTTAGTPPKLETALLDKLYQALLGRAPDGEGMTQFSKMIQERRAAGMSEDDLAAFVTDEIKGSAEYQEKNGVAPTAGVSADRASTATGDVPYINQYEPGGKDGNYTNGASNCGPTSMAMIARSFGYGGGQTDAQLINALGAMGGTTGDGTGVNGIVAMANGIGQSAEMRGPGPNTAWIAEQLQAGKKVVANGDYYAMGDHNRAKVGEGGHYVAVIGMDASGNFLVNDPADSGISPRAFSASELATFIGSNANGGYQVAVG